MGEAIIFHGGGYINNTPSNSENGALIRVHTYIGAEITCKNTTDNRQTTKTAESEIVEFYVGYGSWEISDNDSNVEIIGVDTFQIYEIWKGDDK